MCYPVLAWPIKLLAYAMPSFPVPPIMLLTDMVPRCRLLAAHGLMSCLSARTQLLTATGAPSQTSTMPHHHATPPCHTKTSATHERHDFLKTLTRVDNGRTFHRALALGLSSELPTLCGQLARRSTAKLCHNQVHMTAALAPWHGMAW